MVFQRQSALICVRIIPCWALKLQLDCMNREVLMNSNDPILKYLHQQRGSYISGSELASWLGISRVAVWKRIEVLKKAGYEISARQGRGYCIEPGSSFFSPPEVADRLRTTWLGREIQFFPSLDSTNEELKRLLRLGQASEGLVIAAGRQQRGKGRRGRSWESPAGGLWFSLYLSLHLPLQQLALLSLVFAVALTRALNNFLPVPCGVKWPNDLYCQERKIAGILLESSGELGGVQQLVVGVGINVNVAADDFSNDIRPNSTSLLLESRQVLAVEDVLIGALESMELYLRRYLQEGLVGIREEFKELCVHLGREIEICRGAEKVRGKNIDIDELGQLVIEQQGRLVKIGTGEVQTIV